MNSFLTSQHSQAWSARTRELKQIRLQEHSDRIYAHLYSMLFDRREAIHARLLDRIRSSDDEDDLTVVLATYATHSDVWQSIDAPAVAWYDTSLGMDGDTEEVMEYTLLCPRLALLFGSAYQVEFCRSVDTEAGSAYELCLTFVPRRVITPVSSRASTPPPVRRLDLTPNS